MLGTHGHSAVSFFQHAIPNVTRDISLSGHRRRLVTFTHIPERLAVQLSTPVTMTQLGLLRPGFIESSWQPQGGLMRGASVDVVTPLIVVVTEIEEKI